MNLTESELRQLIKESLIVESSKKKFNKLIEQGKIPEEDFNQMWNSKRNKFNPPFNDDLYRMIVYNTYAAEQNHSIDDFKNNYEYIKQKVLSPFASGGRALAPVTVPGIGIFDVSKSLNDKTTTYDEIMEYAEYKDSVSVKKSNVLQEIIDDAVAGKPNQHLELIHKDNNWIFFYPKSYKGSIAVSRMGGDLKYYGNATQQNSSIGRIPWCIAPDSAGNMFLNYHRRMNLHMYIGTKVGSNYRNTDKNRKVCFSFAKKHGYVDLTRGNSTVNARNTDLSKEQAITIAGRTIFSALEKDAKRPERLEIDEISYYKSVNVPQYQNIEAAIDTNNPQDFERFLNESGSIAQHTESIELLRYIYLKYGTLSSKTGEYVNDDPAAYHTSQLSLILSKIEKNPLFNTSFLQSLNLEISSLPPRHMMIIDSRFIEPVGIDAMNKITGTYRDTNSDAAETLAILSKLQISTTSRKFQDRLALKLVELFSGGGDAYHRDYILNFLNFDKDFSDLVFSKLDKDKIKEIIDNGSRYNITQLVNHPRVYGIVYSSTQEAYGEYRVKYKEGMAKLRKERERPEPHLDPRVTSAPKVFIPPEEIIKIIDNEQGYTDKFIIACITQYTGNDFYYGNVSISDQEAAYIKNRVLKFYYSQGKASKKIMIKQIVGDNNLLSISADDIAKLIYELYKNDIEGYLKFGNTSYDNRILQYPLEDKNIAFIEAYLSTVTKHVLHDLNQDRNAIIKILELGDSKHLIIGKLAKVCFDKKAGSFNSALSGVAMQKILSDDDYDSNLIYALVSSPAVLESEMYDNTVYKILNGKDQTQKETMLYVISTSARKGALTKAQSANVVSVVFDNIDTFYNDKQAASNAVSSIFKFLTNDQKLKMLYKDDGTPEMDVIIRRSSAEVLFKIMRSFYQNVVEIGNEYDENQDIPKADVINFDQYLKYLFLTIGVNQTDIEAFFSRGQSQYGHQKPYYANKTIGNVITIEDYFDLQAQAVDMNKNKKMFEMYFNLSSKVTSPDRDPDDLEDIPAEGDYVQIAKYFEALFE